MVQWHPFLPAGGASSGPEATLVSQLSAHVRAQGPGSLAAQLRERGAALPAGVQVGPRAGCS